MGPFIKDNNSTNKMMKHLLIALTPIILFAFFKNGIIPYKKGYTNVLGMIYPLIFILIPTVLTFIFEIIYGLITKKEIKNLINNCNGILSGLFLGLILPLNTPIIIIIIGALVSFVLTKIIFHCSKKTTLNQSIVGKLFIISVFAVTINNHGGYLNPYEINTIRSSSILTNTNISNGIGTYETLVKPYGRLLNIFIGNIPGAVGETSALLCLIAFVYLTYFKVIKWKISIAYILTVFSITYVIGGSNDLGIWYPLFQIFTGGLMFKAVFMATDSVTSPTTPIGQVLYGMFLGILTVIFRYLTPFEEGVLISILIMNMLVSILDKIGSIGRFNFKIAFMPFIIGWISIIVLGVGISMKFDKPQQLESNFTDNIKK